VHHLNDAFEALTTQQPATCALAMCSKVVDDIFWGATRC